MANNSTETNSTFSQQLSLCEQSDWLCEVFLAYMVVIIVIGVPGNGFIILILTKVSNKFSTDYYILTMSIFDLLCAGINAPLYVLRNVDIHWKVLSTAAFCQFNAVMLYLANISSTLLLTAISVDRYLVTCRPLLSMQSSRKVRARYLSVVIGVVSVIYASCIGYLHDFSQKDDDCTFMDGKYRTTGTMLSYILGILFFLMFIIAVLCYIKVTLAIRSRIKARRRQKVGPEKHIPSTAVSGWRKVRDRLNKVAPSTSPGTYDTICLEQASRLTEFSRSGSTNVQESELNLNDSAAPNTFMANEPVVSLPCSSKTPEGKISQCSVNQHEAITCQLESNTCLDVRNPSPHLPKEKLSESMKQKKDDKPRVREQTPTEKNDMLICPDLRSSEHISVISAVTRPGKSEINTRQRSSKLQTTNSKSCNREKTSNRVTLTVFLLTAVYIITWVINWMASGLKNTRLGQDTLIIQESIFMSKKLFMINCLINPLFYMFLCSKFRNHVISQFKKRKLNR